MRDFLFPMNLQLFAEGGAPSGDGGAGQGTGVTAQAAAVQTKGAKSNRVLCRASLGYRSS